MSGAPTAVSEQALSSESAESPGLLRVLGPGMAIAVVVGNTIGSGIFVKPGIIAASGGSFSLIATVWLVGTVLCVLGTLCLAELAVMLPRAGGMYVYLREAFGGTTAFLFGWQNLLINRPASTGALAVICVDSLSHALRIPFSGPFSVSLACLIVLGLTAINIFGVLWGGWTQAATTIIKCGFVAFIALLPIAMQLMGWSILDASRFSETVTPLRPGTATQAAAVLLAVLWAYNGWEGIAPVAEEVRDPKRNIPIALFGGIGILAVLYLGATLAYHSVIPISEMILPENRQRVAELMVTRLLGPIGGTLMSVGIMLSTFGTINSNMMISPRVTYAMGQDGSFFSIFGRVHAQFRTPVAAILTQGLLTCFLIGLSAVLIHFVDFFRNHTVFDLLTNSVVFVSSIFYALSVAAVVVLRRTQPDRERPFRTPFYPAVPIAYLLVNAWFLYYIFGSNPAEAFAGIGVIAVGVPVYWWFRQSAAVSRGIASDLSRPGAVGTTVTVDELAEPISAASSPSTLT